jgi:hypothetical protein
MEAAAARGPTAMPIVVRYRSRLSDQLHVAMVAGRHSTAYTAIGSVFLVVGVGNAVLLGDATGVLLALLGLSVVSGWFSVPFAWYAVRRAPQVLDQEWETSATSDGLLERSATITLEARWSTFREVQETNRVFLLYGPTGGVFIPKRAFSDDELTAFRVLLEAAGIPRAHGSGVRVVILALAVIALVLITALALAVALLQPSSLR